MNKPYNDLSTYLQSRFGTKVYKIALPGGVTCPTRDGSKSFGGCIFCSEGGSGDFAAPSCLSISEQISYGIDKISSKLANKLDSCTYIAYYQSFTCTYVTDNMLNNRGYSFNDSSSRTLAVQRYLLDLFTPALEDNRICAISIGTRPDCLDNNIISLLADINKIKPIFIELGLQTMHDSSASFIRRGYNLDVFENAIQRLRAHNFDIIVHLILGLPYETKDMMLETVSYISSLDVQGIKLQLLHIIEGTDLAQMYSEDCSFIDNLYLSNVDDYVDILIESLRHLRKDIVIHRLTGDGPHDKLLFPLWSANKRTTLNKLHQTMAQNNYCQGDLI